MFSTHLVSFSSGSIVYDLSHPSCNSLWTFHSLWWLLSVFHPNCLISVLGHSICFQISPLLSAIHAFLEDVSVVRSVSSTQFMVLFCFMVALSLKLYRVVCLENQVRKSTFKSWKLSCWLFSPRLLLSLSLVASSLPYRVYDPYRRLSLYLGVEFIEFGTRARAFYPVFFCIPLWRWLNSLFGPINAHYSWFISTMFFCFLSFFGSFFLSPSRFVFCSLSWRFEVPFRYRSEPKRCNKWPIVVDARV